VAERSRTIGIGSGLPMVPITAEASFVSSVQSLNCAPHPELGDKSPHEVLFGHPPPSLIAMGSTAVVTVARQGANKLQPTARQVYVLHRVAGPYGEVHHKSGWVVVGRGVNGEIEGSPFLVPQVHSVQPPTPISAPQTASHDLLPHIPVPSVIPGDGQAADIAVEDVVDIGADSKHALTSSPDDPKDGDFVDAKNHSKANRRQNQRTGRAKHTQFNSSNTGRLTRIHKAVRPYPGMLSGDAAEAAHITADLQRLASVKSATGTALCVSVHDRVYEIDDFACMWSLICLCTSSVHLCA
jgi:hypothetical protein